MTLCGRRLTKRRGSCLRGGAQLLAKDFDTRAPHSCGIPLYYVLEAMAAYAYSTEQALELLIDSSFENLDSGGEGDIEESEDSGSEGMINYCSYYKTTE